MVLVVAGVSPRVSKSGDPEAAGGDDCDTRFRELMEASCATLKPWFTRFLCRGAKNTFFSFVKRGFVDEFPLSGVVRLESVRTGRCLNRNGSGMGALAVQAICSDTSPTQKFLLVQRSGLYSLEAEGTLAGTCVVAPIRDGPLRLGNCTSSDATFRLWNRPSLDQYSLQRTASGGTKLCWTPATGRAATAVTDAECSNAAQSSVSQEWRLIASKRGEDE